MTEIELREVHLPEDAVALRALDTSFTTDVVYEVVSEPELGFRLRPVRVSPPIFKRFPLDDLDERRRWDRGVLAFESGVVCGFVATGYEAWNRRIVIWHLYVAPAQRGRGIGRLLVEHALAEAPARGARTAWLETSSVNYPGVQAYRRLGFELCGLDTTLYLGTRSDGETALFLARPLVPDVPAGPGLLSAPPSTYRTDAAQDVLADWDDAVRTRRDALAIADPESRTTYRELDALSDAVAADLVARGIGPERLVALDLGRPADLVPAMLGTLKAGGAFVLLDPAAGPEGRGRTRSIDEWLSAIPEGAAAAQPWRDRLFAPAQLAYVVYTSGSTGLPKGIMIERAALSAYARALRERLGLHAGDTWFQAASPGFDVFVEEIVPILTAGGTVACGSTVHAPDPGRLHASLIRAGATIVELTTQYWYEYARWLRVSGTRPPSELRLLIVGGESMDPAAYRDWQARYETPLAHVYGLSECTVTSTLFTGRAAPDAREIPIGWPLETCTLTVRRADAAVPAGRPGEIHIGGICVGRGFLGDPAGTAARYRPDPDGEPGSRVFETGDLGMIGDDGAVFLGRDDDQVKVRGFRLELGEVEVALASLEGAAHAAAILDPRTGSDVVGFVVADAPTSSSAAELRGNDRATARARLRERLPEWALPRQLFLVDELPKTPHGKVDRAALADLYRRLAPPAGRGVLDGDARLRAIVSAFRAALDAPELGPDDDFFEFGGNSLLAMRIVTDLREAHGIDDVEAWTIFDAPTARQLASCLTHMQR